MKIQCTKDDQERILYICENSDWCPLKKCEEMKDCEGCLFSNIEWEITDSDMSTLN